jgi:hypothetical protein
MRGDGFRRGRAISAKKGLSFSNSFARTQHGAVLASFKAAEFFGHSQVCPGLCDFASSGFFLASRTARRSRC